MSSLKFQLRESLITYLTLRNECVCLCVYVLRTNPDNAHTYTADFTLRTAIYAALSLTASPMFFCFLFSSVVYPKTGFVYFHCTHASSTINLLSLCFKFDEHSLFIHKLFLSFFLLLYFRFQKTINNALFSLSSTICLLQHSFSHLHHQHFFFSKHTWTASRNN